MTFKHYCIKNCQVFFNFIILMSKNDSIDKISIVLKNYFKLWNTKILTYRVFMKNIAAVLIVPTTTATAALTSKMKSHMKCFILYWDLIWQIQSCSLQKENTWNNEFNLTTLVAILTSKELRNQKTTQVPHAGRIGKPVHTYSLTLYQGGNDTSRFLLTIHKDCCL